MSDAAGGIRFLALRLAVCRVCAVAIGVSLAACTDRSEPPAATFAKTDGQLLVRAKSIKWSAAPPGLPQGARAALLQGNPNASGPYVIRMHLPPNYKIPFHSHSNAMDVTVVSGTLYMASTQTFDKKKAFAIKPGDFYHLPALASQFLFTKDETVLEIHGDGPYDMKYANAADDPLKGATATPYSFSAGFTDNDMNAADADATVDMSF
jgi:redox-sensitive bicupin YhaK (pirin superfamily)